MPPPNFAKVDEQVYRGGRPEPADYAYLQSIGIRSIVNLEGDDRAADEYASIRTGGKLETALKFFWLWFPLSPEDIYLSGFPAPLMDYLLTQIASMQKPVYIHCQHGQDRTGLVIGLYRMRGGWTYKQAHDEALQHGYRQHINIGLNRVFDNYK